MQRLYFPSHSRLIRSNLGHRHRLVPCSAVSGQLSFGDQQFLHELKVATAQAQDDRIAVVHRLQHTLHGCFFLLASGVHADA